MSTTFNNYRQRALSYLECQLAEPGIHVDDLSGRIHRAVDAIIDDESLLTDNELIAILTDRPDMLNRKAFVKSGYRQIREILRGIVKYILVQELEAIVIQRVATGGTHE